MKTHHNPFLMPIAISICTLFVLTWASFAADMSAYLDSEDGSSSFVVYSAASNELLEVESDGNIGIGTAPGSDAVTVSGTVSADFFSGNGSQLSNLTETDPQWAAASNAIQSEIDSKAAASSVASATNDLWAGLSAEETARDGADSALSNDVAAAQSAIASEETARIGADAALSNDVSSLQSSITAEESARVAADGALSNEVSTVQGSLSTEQAARIGADSSLSNEVSALDSALTAEEGTRAAADSAMMGNLMSLQSSLSTEQNRRIGGDRALSNAVSTLTSDKLGNSGDTMNGVLGINAAGNNSLVITNTGTDIMIGRNPSAANYSIAIGANSSASYDSLSVGSDTYTEYDSVALGIDAYADYQSIAVGRGASALGSFMDSVIAIGYNVTNDINDGDTVVMRGNLYLDGGSSVMVRDTFGSGSYSDLLEAYITGSQQVDYCVPYAFTASKTDNAWKNNTSGEDWYYETFATAVNGMDHTTDGVIDVKLRIQGSSDNGADMFVALRNHTDTNYPVAHAATGLGAEGWWDSAWATVTNTALTEYRIHAYTADGGNYYHIKRAFLIVRYTRQLDD